MFQPIIPTDGLAGWRFLQRTYDTQLDSFARSAPVQRDTDYFAQKIASVTSAEELVADRRLLTVALGAFGLQDDINNRYFIQKILEEGTGSPDTLANRLSDTRYRALADAFGFGPGDERKVGQDGFAAGMLKRFQSTSFEVASGDQNGAMRIALYAQRALPELAAKDSSVDTKWFNIMGVPPLRELFEKALGLPGSVGQIDIDQQLTIFKDRADRVFGSADPAIFGTDATLQDAITKFIVRDQITNVSAGLSGYSIALSLLQR
jgi:hypothetical protein